MAVTVLPMEEAKKTKLHWCGQHCSDCVSILTLSLEFRQAIGAVYCPEGLRVTDEELERIVNEYWDTYKSVAEQIAEQRILGAGHSSAAQKPEEKKWGWTYSGNVWEVKEVEEPKRKLTFREWLDGGMKGECR